MILYAAPKETHFYLFLSSHQIHVKHFSKAHGCLHNITSNKVCRKIYFEPQELPLELPGIFTFNACSVQFLTRQLSYSNSFNYNKHREVTKELAAPLLKSWLPFDVVSKTTTMLWCLTWHRSLISIEWLFCLNIEKAWSGPACKGRVTFQLTPPLPLGHREQAGQRSSLGGSTLGGPPTKMCGVAWLRPSY